MKIESERTVHKSSRFSIVEQVISSPQAQEKKEIVVMGTGVALVAIDSDNDKNVLMIREWRSAFNDYVTQLPGGYCGSDNEDKLLQTVAIEAREELGITEIARIQKIKTYYPSGAIRTTINIYLLTGIKRGALPQPEANEDIQVISLPLSEAYKRFVLGDEYTTSATIIGLTCAKEMLISKSHP